MIISYLCINEIIDDYVKKKKWDKSAILKNIDIHKWDWMINLNWKYRIYQIKLDSIKIIITLKLYW